MCTTSIFCVKIVFFFFNKGNCAVVKPSEVSSHAAELLEELIPKYLDQVHVISYYSNPI